MRFNAQVHLPHGSTVTKVSFIWDDETIFSNSFFWLYRSAMTFSVDTLASDSTYGDLGYTVSYDDTIDNGIVDNSTYSYYLHILHYPDIKFYGVIIEYSFTESY